MYIYIYIIHACLLSDFSDAPILCDLASWPQEKHDRIWVKRTNAWYTTIAIQREMVSWRDMGIRKQWTTEKGTYCSPAEWGKLHTHGTTLRRCGSKMKKVWQYTIKSYQNKIVKIVKEPLANDSTNCKLQIEKSPEPLPPPEVPPHALQWDQRQWWMHQPLAPGLSGSNSRAFALKCPLKLWRDVHLPRQRCHGLERWLPRARPCPTVNLVWSEKTCICWSQARPQSWPHRRPH